VTGLDPLAGIIDELRGERKRLDTLLDEALDQYAIFEEGMNVRMKHANSDEAALLLAERARVEDMLGIVDLVDRIDRIRERIELMQREQAA
jgi:hypothetical protein